MRPVRWAITGGAGFLGLHLARRLLADVLELYPGSTVAVGLDDRMVWSAGFGYANARRQIPVTSTTQFRIDRVSESLTAAALLRLAEEGRVDLDAPVQRYVPSYPEKGYPITPRLLAAHLAGIPSIPPERWAERRQCAQPEETVRSFASVSLWRLPGSRYLHSMPGYVLLSAVVASACGQDFVSCLNEKVFKPAGMTSTVLEDPRSPAPRAATPYERGWFGMLTDAPRLNNTCKWGASGFVSTAEDLARFGMALLRGDLVRRESAALLFTPQKTSGGESTGYGRRFVAERPTWIGIVPVGYADGFQRALTGTTVRVGGEDAPVVGTVSMDSFAVELERELPPGTPVVLVGRGVTLEQHARVAGTINYELATGVNESAARARRVVVDS